MNTATATGGRDRIPIIQLDERRVAETKLRIVIVEDSALIRARLSESLAEIPNLEIVGSAETEQEAVMLLRDAQWDAAVLDLQLRKGTGLGVLKALGQAAPAAKRTVIVFTNYAFPQYKERSLLLGADYFFDKSREFQRVREVLADLAEKISSASH